MGDIDGLNILSKAKEEQPEAEVIVLTGHSSVHSAVTAMQGGAYTYLTKPLDITELRAAVRKASERIRLIRRNAQLARRLDEKFGFQGVIGSSPSMHKVIQQLQALAPTETTVLIQGENGTGKELAAKALHQNSPRKNKPFVPLNISALPESILESELFGHEPGAFTGAAGKRIGKFEYANGGTLFLDEVGEMPMDTQIKLLRVLEERKITRIGSNEERPINVRLLAATNADLKQMMEEGTFREDLYYRISVVAVFLPPLRERRIDIPVLTDHFLKDFAKLHGKEAPAVSRSARQALMAYDWPGNIRQLRNTIERMLVLDTDGSLDVDDLPQGNLATGGTGGGRRRRNGRFRYSRGSTTQGRRAVLHQPRPGVDQRQPRRSLETPRHRRTDAVPEDQRVRPDGVTPSPDNWESQVRSARCPNSLSNCRRYRTGRAIRAVVVVTSMGSTSHLRTRRESRNRTGRPTTAFRRESRCSSRKEDCWARPGTGSISRPGPASSCRRTASAASTRSTANRPSRWPAASTPTRSIRPETRWRSVCGSVARPWCKTSGRPVTDQRKEMREVANQVVPANVREAEPPELTPGCPAKVV